MRKIISISFISLDGVIQSPGSPEEDPSGNFRLGGWVAPFNEDLDNPLMQKLLQPSDLLLGRKTFEIWENYWPENAGNWPGINEVKKFVLSTTKENSDWENSVFVKDLSSIINIRNSPGPDLKVWGSSKLVQLLLENDLIDAFWLLIFPLTLGTGKRLFVEGAIPAAFTLTESFVTPNGVILVNYKRKGPVNTGTIGK
jgi:dihydrofolate reductase